MHIAGSTLALSAAGAIWEFWTGSCAILTQNRDFCELGRAKERAYVRKHSGGLLIFTTAEQLRSGDAEQAGSLHEALVQ